MLKWIATVSLLLTGLSATAAIGTGTASALTPNCPTMDIAGTWDNTHGQLFKIEQPNCNGASLTRLPHADELPNPLELRRPIKFYMDGNTQSNFSSQLFTRGNQKISDTEKTVKGLLDQQRILTQVGPDKDNRGFNSINVVIQGEVPIPGYAPNSIYVFKYVYFGRVIPSDNYYSRYDNGKWKHIYGPVDYLALRTDKLELTDLVSTSSGESVSDISSVLFGANLILKLVVPSISADLVRVSTAPTVASH